MPNASLSKRFVVDAVRSETKGYPHSVTELTRGEMARLTEALHTTMGESQRRTTAQAQGFIQDLPRRLRAKRISLTSLGLKAISICHLHKPMNTELLEHTLCLIQREVTACLRPFDNYPNQVSLTDAAVLDRLRAIRGMWIKPAADLPVMPGLWPYQIDQCAGCMLSRVISDKDALCNLRATLISRTHVRKNHQPRRLMAFIEESINRFSEEEATSLISTASTYAYGLKKARKACTGVSDKHIHRKSNRHQNHPGRHNRGEKSMGAIETYRGNNRRPGRNSENNQAGDSIDSVKDVSSLDIRPTLKYAVSSDDRIPSQIEEDNLNHRLTDLHSELDTHIPYRCSSDARDDLRQPVPTDGTRNGGADIPEDDTEVEPDHRGEETLINVGEYIGEETLVNEDSSSCSDCSDSDCDRANANFIEKYYLNRK
ncbi:hypothetical protein N7493_011684 [Penicillium malachiteum]|uniref:Uncharacterized protein n=1 Tax=Penicillium malachiteum TaxID=1324776 RepID=A0AAD6MQ53_9EURO|nr:hypothetical protein N7493_011684 [Penicillium malachiteum]